VGNDNARELSMKKFAHGRIKHNTIDDSFWISRDASGRALRQFPLGKINSLNLCESGFAGWCTR
jgi:hypothetical protein